eukprot:PhM_4_TR5234/c0_g1_i2/m.735
MDSAPPPLLVATIERFLHIHNMLDDTVEDVLMRNNFDEDDVMLDLLLSQYPDAIYHLWGMGDPKGFACKRLERFYTFVGQLEKIPNIPKIIDKVVATQEGGGSATGVNFAQLFADLVFRYFERLAVKTMENGMGVPQQEAVSPAAALPPPPPVIASSDAKIETISQQLRKEREDNVKLQQQLLRANAMIDTLKENLREKEALVYELISKQSHNNVNSNGNNNNNNSNRKNSTTKMMAIADVPHSHHSVDPAPPPDENEFRSAMREFLAQVNLTEFVDVFFRAGYDDVRSLPAITNEELEAFGMRRAHIHRFWECVRKLAV